MFVRDKMPFRLIKHQGAVYAFAKLYGSSAHWAMVFAHGLPEGMVKTLSLAYEEYFVRDLYWASKA